MKKTVDISILLLLSTALILGGCATVGQYTLPETIDHNWTGNSIVLTEYGYVRGYPDRSDTIAWKGIPYAAPPVGNLRWKAPEKPESWSGVLNARHFSGPCAQYSPIDRRSIIGSEDCLYLNIWRPDSTNRDLPVYVWIHGGGNSVGSSSMAPDYMGYNLADRGRLVFVSINYRLGPFGWFSHPALRSGLPGDEKNDSGNYGTLDIIEALKWIGDNIEYFGGNPDRITVAGESAGGFNVMSLLISPSAKGFFHGAVSQSGGMTTRTVQEGDDDAMAAVKRMLVADGKADNEAHATAILSAMSQDETAAYLRSKSSRDILSAYNPGFGGMIDLPNIFTDGTVITAKGFDTFSSGNYPSKVPLVLGSNSDELRLFLTFNPRYRNRADLFDLASKIGSDNWKAESVDAAARMLSTHTDQPPIYVYHFRWGSLGDNGKSVMPGKWGFELGATHSLEIPFFFGLDTFNGKIPALVIFTPRNKPGRKALSAAMMDYLISFTHEGTPNSVPDGLPLWQPWSNNAGTRKSMVFNAGYEEAEIFMMNQEYTPAGILEKYKALSDPVLFDEALKASKRSIIE